jgi:hypothetical protein
MVAEPEHTEAQAVFIATFENAIEIVVLEQQ